MTRSARRKKQALSATPWLELKNGVEDEQVQDTDTDRIRNVIKQGLKVTKKSKLVGKSAKKLLKTLKQKTGRTLKSDSEELTPLLQVETLSSDSDHEAGRWNRVRKKKRGKKSVHFADDMEHLLSSDSDNDDGNDLEVAKPRLKNKRRKVDQDESSNVTKVKKKDRKNQIDDAHGVLVSRREEKKEREREARRQRRAKKKVCFNCRQPGHQVSECPQATEMGICFKCGAAGHTSKKCKAKVPKETGGQKCHVSGYQPFSKQHGEFPYAKCFVCGEVGHLSRSCPDNPRGLYPRGGGCNVCGSVEHLKANCPAILRRKGSDCSLGLVLSNQSADAEDFSSEETRLLQSQDGHRLSKKVKSKTKVVKF